MANVDQLKGPFTNYVMPLKGVLTTERGNHTNNAMPMRSSTFYTHIMGKIHRKFHKDIFISFRIMKLFVF